MTRFLDLDDVLRIADAAVGAEVLVRDVGLLGSAVARPRTTAFGQDAYPTLHVKAAALLHSLACTHPLVDGNTSLAWAATAVFLGINGHRVVASQDDVVELVLAVADGTLRDVEKIAERLAAWTTGPADQR